MAKSISASERRMLVDKYLTEPGLLAKQLCPNARVEATTEAFEDEDGHLRVYPPEGIAEKDVAEIEGQIANRCVAILLEEEGLILLLRGYRVMLDSDLAQLYGVPVKRLNEQVHRNIRRFPDDFMLRLTAEEYEAKVAICDLKDREGNSQKIPIALNGVWIAAPGSDILKVESSVLDGGFHDPKCDRAL